MHWIIIVFGALIALAGVLILFSPGTIFDPLERFADRPGTHVGAVVARVILGALLISQAATSKCPLVIEILGWISLGAAAALALIGRERFKRLMAWALSLRDRFARVAGLAALLFGGVLVYAFLP